MPILTDSYWATTMRSLQRAVLRCMTAMGGAGGPPSLYRYSGPKAAQAR